MANILNSIIANQPISYKPKDVIPAYTFNTNGRVKPLEDKGKLLPSRIFGSPIEYAKDLKQDVINIGKAAKGEANDHELGRINDLALKLGSLGLATYLFVKNPLKLSKAMEFAGFGTFFASMALWPKLAIQAPLKARTGVDIHQKYIDSQGRKKMLFQDPQYVLTDMYTREDLDRIGNKLGVSKNIDDRDNFIKQRAQKTALQGNTLWMATAGIATPVMSALGCNVMEKPLGNLIENYELKSTNNALYGKKPIGILSGIKQKLQDRSFSKFLSQNSDKPMTEEMINQITSKIGGTKIVTDTVKQQLQSIKVPVDEAAIRETLKANVSESVLNGIKGAQQTALQRAISGGNLRKIADIVAEVQEENPRLQNKVSEKIYTALDSASKKLSVPTVGQASETIAQLHSGVRDFAKRNNVIGNFIKARVGQNAGSYGARQWERFSDTLVKSLGLTTKELKKVADGDMSIIEQKFAELAKPEQSAKFDKVVSKLMKQIADYSKKTTVLDPSEAKYSIANMYSSATQQLKEAGCEEIAKVIPTLAEVTASEAQKNVQGAKSTLFRILQTMDLFKQVDNKSYQKRLETLLQKAKLDADEGTIKRLVAASKKVLMDASISNHVEKFTTQEFNLSEKEFKVVMKALFLDKHSEVEKSLNKTLGKDAARGIIARFREGKDKILTDVANWRNGITPELARRTVTKATADTDAEARNTIIGDTMKDALKKICKKSYNSKKWLHLFGGIMVGLTAATLVTGLFLGRKSQTEKKAEAEKRANV